MKYIGSKRRLAKYLLPIILKDREPFQWYVEPFVGGANMIDKVTGNRMGNDINKYLIALLEKMSSGILYFPYIGEEEYKEIQNNKDNYEDWIVGYAGFNLSFGGKFFGGYRRDKAGVRDYQNESQQNLLAQQILLAQQNLLKDVLWQNEDYRKMFIPPKSIIYCDPPYNGTTKYKTSFDTEEFWKWCDKMVDEGHSVFVSEYNAPINWTCVFEKEQPSSLTKNTGAKHGKEKLFTKQRSTYA